MNTYLILDASNLIYRTFFANIKEDAEVTVGMTYQMSFMSLSKFARKFKADQVVIAFDKPNSWRKQYTQDEGSITHKIYKGQRRQNLSSQELKKLENLDNHLDELATIFRDYTGVVTLRKQDLEADDLIAGFTQYYKDDKHIIVSSDKDFMQLLGTGNVQLIDPMTEKPRNLAEYEYDARYFMFEKCFRGDRGDNVQSSYPRLPSKKIQEAYVDSFKLANIMNHKFVVDEIDKEGKLIPHEYTTRDLFEENEMLMDLTKQPEPVRELMMETITDAVENRGRYDKFKFVRFCNRYDLVTILNRIDDFTSLLAGKRRQF
jgi:hypothetical protein